MGSRLLSQSILEILRLLAKRKVSNFFPLQCHTGETELYVQVGDPTADHNWWDLPERWTDFRPTYKITAERPGSDIAGETASLFTAASILFRGVNDTYSDLLLDHAKSLYEFAIIYRAKYSDSVPEATPYYT